MKLFYEEPEVNIREYKFPADGLITTSGLDEGDGYGDLPENYSIFSN